MQGYYQSTAREVRRLTSVVRSPVYSTFNEALHGAVTIRAFDAQPRMLGVNHQQVGMLQRANLTGACLLTPSNQARGSLYVLIDQLA